MGSTGEADLPSDTVLPKLGVPPMSTSASLLLHGDIFPQAAPHIIDKFLKKLAGWKTKWISMAGRLTLITAVLSALPAYQLIAIIHPKWLHKQLDKMRRAFLWAADDKVCGGKCLVNWIKVCVLKHLGGLGIPNL